MFLVNSGAYIGQEFISEIGLIPPSFLPLGNRCLFEHQAVLAQESCQTIYLSIPFSFDVSEQEKNLIALNKIELLRVPDDLSLGNSIRYCLEQCAVPGDTLQLLHGDTLFERLPKGSDIVSIGKNVGYYQRAILSSDDRVNLLETRRAADGQRVAAGYFSFSDADLLSKLLEQNEGQFISAVNQYHGFSPLSMVEVSDWYDFGHINAYFNSRANFTTERSFNDLMISRDTVMKSSKDKKKLRGEEYWYKHLPAPLTIHTPKLIEGAEFADIDSDFYAYTLEYLYNMPLSDLFVYGKLEQDVWRSIFGSCRDFLDKCQKASSQLYEEIPTTARLNDIFLPKTIGRLEQFSNASYIDLEQSLHLNGESYPSLLEIAEIANTYIPKVSEEDIGLVHGDFCFSNILYDFRTRRIKVIDPRGIDPVGRATLYGDRRYDVAKMYHSVIGLYDFIISGRLEAHGNFSDLKFEIEPCQSRSDIASVFEDVFFSDFTELRQTTIAITVQLFLSMLPLHSDNPVRQKTMLANALRIFSELNK